MSRSVSILTDTRQIEDSIIVGRFDSAYAFANFPKLELQPPHVYASIILDCDSIEDLDDAPSKPWWGGNPTPAPNWMVVNTRPATPQRRAGGIHAVYSIRNTCCTSRRGPHAALALLMTIRSRWPTVIGTFWSADMYTRL